MNRRTLLLLAALTLLLMGGGGLLLTARVRPGDLLAFLAGAQPLWRQLLFGFIFGFICAKAAWQLVELPFMRSSRVFFTGLIRPMRLNILEILFVSICAGIGEELLFRGGIQPLLGIWTTSLLFVVLHGYINPFNLALTAYGIFMIAVIGVMGLMTEHLGILSAMAAHTVVDVYLLNQLSGRPMEGEGEG
jgi:uncharacterized protein